MEMSGEQLIAASREKVWAALNDPEVLRQCIPGCQSLEHIADDRMKAVAGIKVGPIGARFSGEVQLSELDPPNGYRITGEGQGGAAGFAKGGAVVRLRDEGEGTLLSYDVEANVGGRLAQLGGPIIDATARQMAGAFFRKFSAIVAQPEEKAEPAAPASAQPVAAQTGWVPAAAASPAGPAAAGGLPTGWILAVAVALLAGVLIGSGGLASGTSAWTGLAIGLALILAAFAGFEHGRRTAQPVIQLDSSALEQLAALLGKRKA